MLDGYHTPTLKSPLTYPYYLQLETPSINPTCMIRFTDTQLQQLQEQFSANPPKPVVCANPGDTRQTPSSFNHSDTRQTPIISTHTPQGRPGTCFVSVTQPTADIPPSTTHLQSRVNQRYTYRLPDHSKDHRGHAPEHAPAQPPAEPSTPPAPTKTTERHFLFPTWLIPVGYWIFIAVVAPMALLHPQHAYAAASAAAPVLFLSLSMHSMCSQNTVTVFVGAVLILGFPVICYVQDATYTKEYCYLFSVFAVLCNGRYRLALTYTGLCALVMVLCLRTMNIPYTVSCYLIFTSICLQIAQDTFRICRCNILATVQVAV